MSHRVNASQWCKEQTDGKHAERLKTKRLDLGIERKNKVDLAHPSCIS
jgi:hypothetical protein